MNIDIKDVITLEDDKNYAVASKIQYNNRDCFYLVDLQDNKNIKFCYLDGTSLVEITDNNLLKELAPLFVEASAEALN